MNRERMPRNPLFDFDNEEETTQEGELPTRAYSPSVGRPRKIRREYDKSSQEGLPENFTRATFILREDLLKKLKDYAYTERETLKDVMNKMLEDFLRDKEVIERRESK